MAIDWMKFSTSLSKRWDGRKQDDASSVSPVAAADPSSVVKGDKNNNNNNNDDDKESGTRFYIHITFGLHLVAQLVNALIQHYETPIYAVYIFLLHGPVLLFMLWMVQIFQRVMAIAFFQLPRKNRWDVILSPMGGMTMHPTTNISQDIKVSLMIPLGHILLILFFLGWYIVFDDASFDETIHSGVDFEEMKSSFAGLLANVAAQSMWIGIYLVALHIAVPVFPLSGASFFAACLSGYGLGLVKSAMVMDIFGALITFTLFLIGGQETFYDDQNGIGVFILFNALTLIVIILNSSLERIEDHPLVTRPCYDEREEIPATETSTSKRDMMMDPVGSLSSLSSTPGLQDDVSSDATNNNNNKKDDDMKKKRTSTILDPDAMFTVGSNEEFEEMEIL